MDRKWIRNINGPYKNRVADLVTAPFTLVRQTSMEILMKWQKNISEAKEVIETCFVFYALNELWRSGMQMFTTLSHQSHIVAIIC